MRRADTAMRLTETAHAKLNLALHVRRRRADGYHELDTLFAFARDGDVLTAEPAAEIRLSIIGRFGTLLSEGTDNLVIRAVQMLAEANNIRSGLSITLEKNLPVAAGIGGGSADAAAALRLATRLWGLPLDAALGVAASIGADVPACVRSQTVHGTGVGDQLQAVETDVGGTPVLLVNPLIACPTGPVFRAWDGLDHGALEVAHWRAARNDLQAPAIALVPEISAVLDCLSGQAGVTLHRMSGSGATCFALFDTKLDRDVAAHAVSSARPDWWTLPTTLI